MAKQVKCPVCGKMNNKEDTTQRGKRYYCKQCAINEQTRIDKNKDGWGTLFNYICKLYNIETLTPVMFKQIKDYREDPYKFTNIGMYLTLKYYYETLGNTVKDNTAIGIIPYYYNRAKRQYLDVMQIEKYMEDFELTEKERLVKLKKTNNANKQIVRKQMNYNDISWEE